MSKLSKTSQELLDSLSDKLEGVRELDGISVVDKATGEETHLSPAQTSAVYLEGRNLQRVAHDKVAVKVIGKPFWYDEGGYWICNTNLMTPEQVTRAWELIELALDLADMDDHVTSSKVAQLATNETMTFYGRGDVSPSQNSKHWAEIDYREDAEGKSVLRIVGVAEMEGMKPSTKAAPKASLKDRLAIPQRGRVASSTSESSESKTTAKTKAPVVE